MIDSGGGTVVATDWIAGGDRHSLASKRIYAAALELIIGEGWNDFSVDVIAERVHCSRATIYRHVGGKTRIRNGVLAAEAAAITRTVRSGVEGLQGPGRCIAAMTLALEAVRAHPAFPVLAASLRDDRAIGSMLDSPVLASHAADLTGIASDDVDAARWVIRVFLSMVVAPGGGAATDRVTIARFVAPVLFA